MPLHRIRLEDTESEHFRLVSVRADTPAEALAIALRNERKSVGFTLKPGQLEEIEAIPAAKRTGKQRGMIHTHGQSEPYKVVRMDGKPVNDKLLAEAEQALADRDARLAEAGLSPDERAGVVDADADDHPEG